MRKKNCYQSNTFAVSGDLVQGKCHLLLHAQKQPYYHAQFLIIVAIANNETKLNFMRDLYKLK